MHIALPYHSGELAVQTRLGELEHGARNGRAISDSIIGGAFRFVEQQSMVVLGSVDGAGDGWASILFGEPGFLHVRDERTLELDLSRAAVHANDPLLTNLQRDPRVGLLLIELATRRRLRINGTVTRDGDLVTVQVEESFPNCPKYIQRRALHTQVSPTGAIPGSAREGTRLTADQRELIGAADTFFVASSNPQGGQDVSHRGGPQGFVQLVDERTLRIPDYAGNHMYTTLGNFERNPAAGLVFLDFENSTSLMLSGRARLVLNAEGPDARDVDDETSGTGRFWEFEVERTLELPHPVQLEWELLEGDPRAPW